MFIRRWTVVSYSSNVTRHDDLLYITCLLIVCLQVKLELSKMNVKIWAVVGLKVKQLSLASQSNITVMAIQLTSN